jgi:hypothetical protein
MEFEIGLLFVGMLAVGFGVAWGFCVWENRQYKKRNPNQ